MTSRVRKSGFGLWVLGFVVGFRHFWLGPPQGIDVGFRSLHRLERIAFPAPFNTRASVYLGQCREVLQGQAI